MKKLLTIALALIIVVGCLFGLTACQKADYTIGICQLVPHPALDAATKGFKDAVEEGMKAAGKTVKFEEKNAAGESTLCQTIINTFCAIEVDLIMANATPAVLAAKTATKENKIPVLGTSVTDYSEIVCDNVSGTSDLAVGALEAQAGIVKELFPTATKVALLYCSAETNSKVQVDEIKTYFTALNIETKEFPFGTTDELQSVTTAACEWGDAIFVPTDNKIAENTEVVANVCKTKRIPVIAGEEGICGGCGVATYTIDYYQLGRKTGEMALEILLNGGDISTMEVQKLTPVYKYNKQMCEDLGILDLIDTDKYLEIE